MPEIDNSTLSALATNVGALAAASDSLRQANYKTFGGSASDPDSFDAEGRPATDPAHGDLGYYPLTDGSGGTIFFPCWERQILLAGEEVGEAVLDAAQDSADAAAASATAADGSADLAAASKTAADADAAATATDRTAVHADKLAADADAVATAADRVQTGIDKAAAAASATAAGASAATATAQATIATTKAAEAGSHKDAAYGYAQSAAAAVAYQNLSAVALSKAISAVDLFVYDTSKDSDGGAWRKRCQHLSWYNETLNTATRGARKDFPAVAVLIAEADKVTIFDADDPALPMWMVLARQSNGIIIGANGYNFTSIAMLNGELVVGQQVGLARVNFVSDSQFYNDLTTTSGPTTGVIGRRGIDGEARVSSIAAHALVNRAVNDVAMTVLPDAPADPVTGLPIATIGVATDGNGTYSTSLITQAGAIYNLASDSTGSAVAVAFQGATLSVVRSDGTVYVWNDVGQIAAHGTAPSATYSPSSIPALLGTTARISRGRALGSSSGLALLLADQAAQAKGMVARITSAYNSGWMVGDIRGAWMASKDTASLVGAEMWTAGLVDTGWTVDGCTVAVNGANLDFTFTASNKFAYKSFTTVVGETYVVEVAATGIGRALSVSTNGVNGNPIYLGSSTTPMVKTFTATQTTYWLGLSSLGGAGTVSVSAISIGRGTSDRSVKANGLKVIGTITRAVVATGAELVGLSGFSAANYLEQPYNADLDFGTGDFAFMGWIKQPTAAVRTIVDRRDAAGAGALIRIDTDAAGLLQLRTFAGAFKTVATTAAITDGLWHFVVGLRRSGVIELWVDGVQIGTLADTDNLTNISAVLRFGAKATGGSENSDGTLSLWRASATAPSANQIRQMFADERMLFQAGAACTLSGASDAVTALAHDPDTGLLHVGSSAGRSVFQGLRRVTNTANAVAVTIAAANNLVMDD